MIARWLKYDGIPSTATGTRPSPEILRTVVGSGVHGIAIAGTDDHDEMGVFVEPPETVVGVGRPVDHYVYRTQPEGARSGPGDVDLVMYSVARVPPRSDRGRLGRTNRAPESARQSAALFTSGRA